MSDPLDDLRAELSAVTPSAGFEHRTKARVARAKDEETASARWGTGKWGGLAAAAAVIATVAAGVTVLRQQDAAVPAPQVATTQSPVTGAPPHSADAAAVDINAPVPAHSSSPARLRARVTRAAMVIPEAAHRDQNIAVRRLMQLARVGTFVATPNTAANALPALDEDGPVPIPVPIEISPITIAPLVPPGAAGRGGNGQ